MSKAIHNTLANTLAALVVMGVLLFGLAAPARATTTATTSATTSATTMTRHVTDVTDRPDGSVTTTYSDGSYTALGAANAYGFRDSLAVNPAYWTGNYHQICTTGGHPGQSPCVNYRVYKRTFHACKGQILGAVQDCMTAQFVYSAGYAVCFDNCTVTGLRGYAHCQTEGSDSALENVTLSACYRARFMAGSAGKVEEHDRICTQGPFGICKTDIWHVNAYYTGYVGGPYSGAGSDD